MLPSASFELALRAYQERIAFQQKPASELGIRDEVFDGGDNTHPTNYEAEDPFGGWRRGGTVLHFADVERPDLGEVPA